MYKLFYVVEFFKAFLNSNSKTILNKSLSINEQVKKLADGIELLNNELQKQVLEKYNDLLQQASHATKLEEVLNIMNIHVHNLMANADRLKTQVIELILNSWYGKKCDLCVNTFR